MYVCIELAHTILFLPHPSGMALIFEISPLYSSRSTAAGTPGLPKLEQDPRRHISVKAARHQVIIKASPGLLLRRLAIKLIFNIGSPEVANRRVKP